MTCNKYNNKALGISEQSNYADICTVTFVGDITVTKSTLKGSRTHALRRSWTKSLGLKSREKRVKNGQKFMTLSGVKLTLHNMNQILAMFVPMLGARIGFASTAILGAAIIVLSLISASFIETAAMLFIP